MANEKNDYISLTDMLKAKDGDFFISDWLRNRNTVEFLGIWERVHNPKFNYGEFAVIKSQVGLNSYKISVKEWVEKTNAIGIRAAAGRYGGTYAHQDIAFEFGMWISDAIKEHLIPAYLSLSQINITYATEADVLNKALFGVTAKEWQTANPKKAGNLRDHASVAQLVCLANLESLNAVLIRQVLPQKERLLQLNEVAIIQMRSLVGNPTINKLK